MPRAGALIRLVRVRTPATRLPKDAPDPLRLQPRRTLHFRVSHLPRSLAPTTPVSRNSPVDVQPAPGVLDKVSFNTKTRSDWIGISIRVENTKEQGNRKEQGPRYSWADMASEKGAVGQPGELSLQGPTWRRSCADGGLSRLPRSAAVRRWGTFVFRRRCSRLGILG